MQKLKLYLHQNEGDIAFVIGAMLAGLFMTIASLQNIHMLCVLAWAGAFASLAFGVIVARCCEVMLWLYPLDLEELPASGPKRS